MADTNTTMNITKYYNRQQFGEASDIPKPSPVRPAPVKHMPATTGKRIFIEKPMDGTYNSDHSSTRDSPKNHRSSKKSNKRRASTSSSSSSSSVDSTVEPTQPKRQKTNKRESRHYQSRSTTTPTVSVGKIETSGGNRPSSNHPQPPRPTSKPKQTAASTAATTAGCKDVLLEDPSDEVVEDNRRVLKSIRAQQPPRGETDAASCAASSVVSKRTNRANANNKISFGYLEQCLCDDLRENTLALESVRLLYSNFPLSHMKQKQVIDMVRNMYSVPSTVDDVEPRIKNDKYLFCTFNNTFGYDQEALKRSAKYADRSLSNALGYRCDKSEHSLDIVFRQALKEIADELYTLDTKQDVSLDNPVFISGQYLELRLLQKIRRYYKIRLDGQDVSKYLTESSVDTNSPLHKLVSENAAEEYVRTLYDRYQLRPDTFDDVLKNVSFAPTKLRVWTDVTTQSTVNATMTNFLKKAYGDRPYSIYKGGIEEIIDVYATEMKGFVAANKEFLAEMCRASELFAWMCLGVMTDDQEEGTMHMATSFHLVKKEQASGKVSPFTCWNYPLASMLDRELPAVSEKKIAKYNFIQGIENAFSEDLDDHL